MVTLIVMLTGAVVVTFTRGAALMLTGAALVMSGTVTARIFLAIMNVAI